MKDGEVMEDNQLVGQIIRFWLEDERIKQVSYSRNPNPEITSEIIQKNMNTSRIIISPYFEMDHQEDLLIDQVKNWEELLHKKQAGGVTVYIGKIKRDDLLRAFEKLVPHSEIEEKNYEKLEAEIVLATFKMDQQGNYIPDSFEMSHSMLALIQYAKTKEITDDYCLSSERYYDYMLKGIGKLTIHDLLTIDKEIEREATPYIVFSNEAEERRVFSFQAFYYEKPPLYPRINKRSSLHLDYYEEDLKEVETKLADQSFCESQVGQNLMQFIKAQSQPSSFNKFDFFHPSLYTKYYDVDHYYYNQLLDLYDPKKASLASWDGKISNALTETYLSLAIHDQNREIKNLNHSLFSITIPPFGDENGIIKELIAHHVVEKAAIMAKIDDPDDIFEQPKKGVQYRAIASFYEDVNNHSVLITAATNNELLSLIDELSKIQEELSFESPVMSGTMGNQSLTKTFYAKVLNPYLYAVNKNETINHNKADYRLYLDKWKDQYAKVLALENAMKTSQQNCKDLSQLHARNLVDQEKFEQLQVSYNKQNEKLNEQLLSLQKTIKVTQKQNEDNKKASDEKTRSYNQVKKEKEELDQKLTQLEANVSEIESSHTFFYKLFKRRLYKEELNKLETLAHEKQVLVEQQETQKEKLEAEKTLLDACKRKEAQGVKERENIEHKITEIKKEKERLHDDLDKQEMQLKKNKDQEAQGLLKLKEEASSKALKFSDTLNKQFLYRNAPWQSQELQQEKHQLFLLSLELMHRFALASKYVRNNMKHLAVYLGYRKKDQYTHFEYSECGEMVPELLKTLFLCMPFLASTLASSHYMFRNANQPGLIGQLIVMNAQCALPQMVIGSIYRAGQVLMLGNTQLGKPILHDEEKFVKYLLAKQDHLECGQKIVSAMDLADAINRYGSYIANNIWVGCPVINISGYRDSQLLDYVNKAIYRRILDLKQVEGRHTPFKGNGWLNVQGETINSESDYVIRQGQIVCEILDRAFEKDKNPDLLILTPFTSVQAGLRHAINEHYQTDIEKTLILNDWLEKHVVLLNDTLYQPANNVIVVLGCDEKTRAEAFEAIDRRKFQEMLTLTKNFIQIIGDISLWKRNRYLDHLLKYCDVEVKDDNE